MFDYFRDVIHEVGGLDTKAAEKKRVEKKLSNKKNRIILSKNIKLILIICAALYIIISLSTVVAISHMMNITYLVLKNILMSVLAFIIIISLAINKKEGEITAIICSIVFILALISSDVFLFPQ